LLAALTDRFQWLCHAWCLMDNHYHLVIETPEGNLSRGMRQLNGMYTQKYNWKYHKTGHVFQGRYKAIIVDKDSYLLELCRYVVLNPVRAHIVEKPDDFQWSSYRATSGIDKAPSFLITDWLLAQFSSNRKRAEKLYKEFVFKGITQEAPWKELKGQIFLGDSQFIQRIKTSLPHDLREVPRSQRFAERPPLPDLTSGLTTAGKTERNKVIHEAHVRYGYTLKEIADQLGIHYATVSRIVKKISETSV
ncbi:MAG: addiction module toxin RelE, partial [Chlorobiaceae bacterium]|nr:addiction module toxin RelE [Chlorobiaceae bacterium]